MLELRNIKKTYSAGANKVAALDDVSLNFRDNEFVAILGQSGSGKTTLLNIIGGLDRYDSGELIINSRSTRQYKDKDWDSYRNHSVGFVFQNYNLIEHQTVLANVELALTLSGVSKEERRKRAKKVLRKVGLSDQMNKKPNQMSGGQMQRVAIARALVNDPDILLADEPTGALDSKTSVQIMELIREISKDRLVIMVTHNPKLAKEYASRLIRIKDGRVRKDSDPFVPENPTVSYSAKKPVERKAVQKKGKKKDSKSKPSMSFATALSLSFNNLLTKKGRTMLTSFAGSIGIIGIALILSLSNGMQAFISGIERDTLASYPLMIERESFDISQLLSGMNADKINAAEHENDKIYKLPTLQGTVGDMQMETKYNDLTAFGDFLRLNEEVYTLCTDIKYGYDVDFRIFKADTSEGAVQLKPNDALNSIGINSGDSVWQELVGDEKLLSSQYDILEGTWPKNFNELVLFVDENNEISDLTFYALGLADVSELEKSDEPVTGEEGEEAPIELEGFEYSEFLNLRFRLIPSTAVYQKVKGVWKDMSDDETYMKKCVNAGQEIKIVGIARPKSSTQSAVDGGTVGYTTTFTEYLLKATKESGVVKAQMGKPDIDVFTGLPFYVKKDAKVAPTSTVSMPDVVFAANNSALPETMPVANAQGEFKAMSEDEIHAYIEENYEGEQKEELDEFVTLALKDVHSVSERRKLMSYLDKALEGTDSSSTEAYGAIKMMNKDMKLQLISAIITVNEGGEIDIPTQEEIEQSKEESSSAQQSQPDKKPSGSSKPESKPEPEPEPEPTVSYSTYEENLEILGVKDIDSPSSITIYPTGFEAKERIIEIIEEYNQAQTAAGKEDTTITYTDYVSVIMSSVTQVIDLVTYALVAFVAISLIVSSIMIGIITYISVLERTKEIGILRSIGASKRDISRVFNCETIIVGLTSGGMGILLSLLLLIPINAIIKAVADIPGLAVMPLYGGIALIAISVVLTLIAGLIPSRVAAKKDPVTALRS